MSDFEDEVLPEASSGLQPNVNTSAYCKISVKFPPFWPDKPSIWFAQVDAQFRIAGITNELTKFYHVVAHLENRYAKEVEDIILNPPDVNPFIKLKDELIRRLSKTSEQRIRQLLSHEELGDKKPSQFLRHLRSLADNDGISDEVLRSIWSNRLPIQLQTIIASQRNLPLNDIAELADNVFDILPHHNQLHSVMATFDNHRQHCDTSTDGTLTHHVTSLTIESMTKKIDELSHRLDQVLQSSDPRRTKRSQFRQRSRSRSRQSRADNNCWYHMKFGSKANKCVPPCSWKPKNDNDGL